MSMKGGHPHQHDATVLAVLSAIDERLRLLLQAIGLFSIFFVTKIFGYLDVPVIVAMAMLVIGHRSARIAKSDGSIEFYFLLLCFFAVYALGIALLYGVQEIIFALKFVRTLLLFCLLYFVWSLIRVYWTYEQFLKAFVYMVVIHSLIVLACVTMPDVREAIYAVTGFEPRGPAWARSPGLTISYNSPTILHVLGLWLLVSRKYWPGILRMLLGLIVFSSLVFMGRTIAFLGLIMIFGYLVFFAGLRRRVLGAIAIAMIGMAVVSGDALLKSIVSENVYASINKFVMPIRAIGTVGGLDSYYQENLADHIYVSSDPKTVFFGNSRAGHIGLLDPRGETDSDIGLVNSINANGIFLTALVYAFYLLMLWQVSSGDWKTISFLVLLPLALSFKETGLFTSHATAVLFIAFFYNHAAIIAGRRMPKEPEESAPVRATPAISHEPP